METILLVIQVLIALALIGIVLIQRSDNDGFGMGSGGGGMGLLSGRAKANALTRTTAILAAAFMLNSLLLGILTTRGGGSIADRIVATQPERKEEAPLSAPLARESEQAPAETPVTPPAEEGAAAPAAEAAPVEAAPAAPVPADEVEPLTVPRAE